MKDKRRYLILAAIIQVLLSATLHAEGSNAQILTDDEMASVRGAFCAFQKCQTGVATGKCQPIPNVNAALCTPKTCTFSAETFAGIELVGCTLTGQVTCTKNASYRQCIAGSLTDICWQSSINVCGTLVEPTCKIDLANRTCDCLVLRPDESCDWTNCLLGGQ
jgi:hypothetical protein